jgi:hypothetical protein
MGNYALWTNWTNLYDEYRVLSMYLEYAPFNTFNKIAATQATASGIVVIDRDSNAALTSTASAASYSSAEVMDLDHPWLIKPTGFSYKSPSWRMDGVNDATWITTSAPVATTKPNIKMYFGGLANSSTYGLFVSHARIQFRGRF